VYNKHLVEEVWSGDSA